jgi:hypothetical protein
MSEQRNISPSFQGAGSRHLIEQIYDHCLHFRDTSAPVEHITMELNQPLITFPFRIVLDG